eukprot:2463186-Prymnesium_polylepis.1
MVSDPTLATDVLWEGYDDDFKLKALKGSFTTVPCRGQGPLYDSFWQRWLQLPPIIGANGTCSLEKDDDNSAYLWAQDHDNNASTPLRCNSGDAHFDAFGYDAVFAVAHALHDLLEVQNRTEVVGSELLDTLIKRVSFEGATGFIDFYDASADPDRLYLGDRREGFSFELGNYVDLTEGFVTVGSWTPCSAASCSWAERWQPMRGVGLMFSTRDNSRPTQLAAPR